jgi:beta-carotene 3-hydroxylase
MLTAIVYVALALATFAAMEAVAYLTHKHVMHGWLWSWHRSHHEPHDHALERNDLFAVVFSLPSVALIYLGHQFYAPLLPIGIGIAGYGLVYLLFHDGLVHRRYPFPFKARSRYWRRLVQAHRLHHAVRERDGGVSFGFLYAPPPPVLKAQLQQRRKTRHARRDGKV